MIALAYDSIDEAVEDLTIHLLPSLLIAKAVADSGYEPRPTPEVYRDLCRLIPLLEDAEALRRSLERYRAENGQLKVRFTPEAEALWRKAFPGGKP
jgi:hypothetical protein